MKKIILPLLSQTWSLFWLAIFFVALILFVLLSFAYRDYSHSLLALTLFTFLGLLLPTFLFATRSLLIRNKGFRFSSELKETRENSLVMLEENDDEYNLEGRFCIND